MVVCRYGKTDISVQCILCMYLYIWNISTLVQLYISLICCANLWDIKLNTRGDILYVHAPMDYPLFDSSSQVVSIRSCFLVLRQCNVFIFTGGSQIAEANKYVVWSTVAQPGNANHVTGMRYMSCQIWRNEWV